MEEAMDKKPQNFLPQGGAEPAGLHRCPLNGYIDFSEEVGIIEAEGEHIGGPVDMPVPGIEGANDIV